MSITYMYAVHYYEIVNELLKTVLVTILVTHPGNYTVVRVTSYLFQLSQISREITKTVSEGLFVYICSSDDFQHIDTTSS